MPLIEVHVIENVFNAEQRRQMILISIVHAAVFRIRRL